MPLGLPGKCDTAAGQYCWSLLQNTKKHDCDSVFNHQWSRLGRWSSSAVRPSVVFVFMYINAHLDFVFKMSISALCTPKPSSGEIAPRILMIALLRNASSECCAYLLCYANNYVTILCTRVFLPANARQTLRTIAAI